PSMTRQGAAFRPQMIAHGGILAEPDGDVVGGAGLPMASQLPEQMAAHRPVRLIARGGLLVDRVQTGEAGGGPGGFRHRGGVGGAGAEGRGQAHELLIERGDGGPFRAAGAGALGMPWGKVAYGALA